MLYKLDIHPRRAYRGVKVRYPNHIDDSGNQEEFSDIRQRGR